MNTASAKVYVVHEPLKRETDPVTRTTGWVRTRDVTIAREYGELRYIYPAGRLSQDPDYLVRTAREKLRDFTSNDYLLLLGDTAAIAIATVIAAQQLEADARHLQLLLWDGRLQCYYPVRPEIWEPDSEEASMLDGVSPPLIRKIFSSHGPRSYP